MREIQQTLAGFGFDGDKNHNRNRNRANEEARGHLGGDRGPKPRRRPQTFEESSGDEDDHFREEVDGRRRTENSNSFRVKIDLPYFNGYFHCENLLDWILEVENFFAYMQTPESKQVKLVAYKLCGWASDWWEQM